MSTSNHDPKTSDFDIRLRIVTLGDNGVGKTSLMSVLSGSDEPEEPSVGVNVMEKLYDKNDLEFAVEYWDVPGGDSFRQSVACYCAGAAGLALVFSVTNRLTLQNIEKWLSSAKVSSEIPRILIGNQADTPAEEREVSTSRAEAFAQRHGLRYFETSCATGQGVGDAYMSLFSSITKGIVGLPDPSRIQGTGVELGERLVWDEKRWMGLFGGAPV
jgi:small GTP-binding protein